MNCITLPVALLLAENEPFSHQPPVSSPPGIQGRPDDVSLLERQPLKAPPPTPWRVLLLNDDYTPMEFVVFVLQEFFAKEHEAAVRIMLKVHHEGRGLCGVYTRDVAHTKVALVVQAAKEAGHPLQCVCEPVQNAEDGEGSATGN